MKTINYFFLMVMTITMFNFSSVLAQEEDDQPYLILSYNHYNLEKEDFDMERLMELEKEYRTKVLNKNEYIRNFFTFTHRITDDNSEVINGMIVRGWDNIRKMQDQNSELVEKAWPEMDDRRNFFSEMNSYYTMDHADEIYYSLPYHNKGESIPEGDIVIHFRVNHTKAPMGIATTNKEFMELQNWFVEEILPENEYVYAYFPYTHAWGSSGTEFLEIWVYNSMEDMEKATQRMGEIANANKSEEELKALGDKWSKYFTSKHEDYIYSRESELSKRSINAEVSK